MSDSYQHKY